ncbi:MalY/PatB family protein [Aeromicrobium sp. Leaf350]|uniref:MalY/PatB family protein n=1 Tax=Aeromicrobium sp. Leaf350 TaxID=2876565 RepID=UPI001E28251D|nr:aminotransferase class I/II-fold pyridoxal phosphate-dependent enzyme [Aeromicrobium sp. Leaf350]
MRPLRELTLPDLRARRSVKWSWFGPDVLPLWVAEMDAPLAPAVTRVLEEVATSGDLGYPDDRGYAAAFATFARGRWAWEPGFARPVADVMTGVVEALRLTRRDTVILTPPVYPPFFDAIALVGARPVEVPLGEDWGLDLDALADAFEAHAGQATVLLCNPHNPTSIAPSRAELLHVAELARHHDVRVVVDEIHAPLADPVRFAPYLSLPGTEDAVVVTSASKAWNLAGVKAALLVAGDDVADAVRALPELLSHGPSQVGIRTQEAAWAEGVEWLDAVRADLAENRRLVAELLHAHLPQAGIVMGDDSYLAWLDLAAYDLGGEAAVVLRERAGVALGEASPFGALPEPGRARRGGPDFARLNYATTPEVLTAAFERLGAAVDAPA